WLNEPTSHIPADNPLAATDWMVALWHPRFGLRAQRPKQSAVPNGSLGYVPPTASLSPPHSNRLTQSVHRDGRPIETG
ncbi:MAG: hypothetical protein NZM29_01515, partial [Nitrospira sp.]|nr:hypothetical protein [Nitrospira sp.]